ncbi:M18 family aminopeptidase [Marinilabilia sp.]|uniref:M18 family aminopeptidase n=1 Tax=Marinilabilia sp. TaxID=2021252 RepID=UPI0025B8FDC2|nr:M18 family aminopeptidase [Marinilabilia sp.]
MNNAQKTATELIDFIHEGASPYHVVESITKKLHKAGFEALKLEERWKLEPGKKYFTTKNGSSVYAFITGTKAPSRSGTHLICAHSDSPSFKIKPSPEIIEDGYYIKFNTEVYGGPILMSWLDRPLSMAGRVIIESNNTLHPETRLVNFNRPILTIPNLAIHLNRSVNEGVELNKQKDMLPLCGIIGDKQRKGYFKDLLSREAGVEAEKIIDFDITLNEFHRGCLLGPDSEFISSPKLDDLAMVHAGLKALLDAQPTEATNFLCIFDNEEVGSQTKQGAGSPVFKNIFERVLKQLGEDDEGIQQAQHKSFMISADMAHSVHPNHPDKHDPVLHPLMNKGPVIKIHANQKYTTDGDSGAVFESICRLAGIPCQKFVNRSDMVGGSTLGNVLTTQMDIRSVDVGNAMLAMHSVRELAGVQDHEFIIRVFKKFFAIETRS